MSWGQESRFSQIRLILVTKKSQKRCGKFATGMFDGREIVLALSSSSSDTAKSCLLVEQNVDIAAVVMLPGVWHASFHGNPHIAWH